MSRPSTDGARLTAGLRDLVWGIESEVAVVTSLSRRIDEHVRALNALRAELADRLAGLDELRAGTGQTEIAAYLDRVVHPVLPERVEVFPDRMYGP